MPGDERNHRIDGAHVVGTLALVDPATSAICYLTVSQANALLVNGAAVAGGGVSPALYTAKGALLGASAASTPAALLVGTNGQMLVADSTATTGLNWATPTVDIPTSIGTTKGDLIGFTGSAAAARLAVGANGTILTADSTKAAGFYWGPATPHTDTLLYATDYGATFDGVTDDTAAIQSCIAAVAALGGGIAQLPVGTGVVTGLELKSGVHLRGLGQYATKLYLKTGSNTSVIHNYVSPDAIISNGMRVGVSEINIDGNKSGNSSGHGVYFTLNPGSTKATNDIFFDPHDFVFNCYIENCKQTGVWVDGRSEFRAYNVTCNRCDQYGFRVPYDSFIVSCTASYAGLTGFYCIETNAKMTDCKAFLCGQITAGSGHGFRLYNSTGSACVNCIAQDNLANGFAVETFYGAILAGCVADSNSTSSAGSFVGYDLYDAHYSKIVGCTATDRRNDGVNTYQTKALQIRNASDYNVIDITNYGYNSAAMSAAPVRSTPAVGNGNKITINGSVAMPQETVTWSATVTPNPWNSEAKLITLTGNTTFAAPSNSPWLPGTRLRFILAQDATGSRTLTWNATYKGIPTIALGAASQRLTVEFEYNGTDWQCVNTVGWAT